MIFNNYKTRVFCMNCFKEFNYKFKKGVKILKEEVNCKKCDCKDKIRISKNGYGGNSYYIN